MQPFSICCSLYICKGLKKKLRNLKIIKLHNFREPLLGIKEGYAPHNFSFNFLFFLPAIIISLGLGIAVIARTMKHWKRWNNLNKKLIFIGLSSPVILLFIFQTIRILTIE